jgi:hypothetical protein
MQSRVTPMLKKNVSDVNIAGMPICMHCSVHKQDLLPNLNQTSLLRVNVSRAAPGTLPHYNDLYPSAIVAPFEH